jgi:hypothetical protein
MRWSKLKLLCSPETVTTVETNETERGLLMILGGDKEEMKFHSDGDAKTFE